MTDRVREILSWYASDDPGTKANLYRMLNHGRLAGTVKPVMLPVDQGLEHVNRQIGRRRDVVGGYPNDAALIRLAGAPLIEQNDEWLVGRRYVSDESLQALFAGPAA